VGAAVGYLRHLGIETVTLAGYSFGAWVNAHFPGSKEKQHVDRMVMVAPPVAFMAFDPAVVLPQLSLVVVGTRDEFAPVHEVKKNMSQWNSEAALDIIQGADHFLFGFLDRVEAAIDGYLKRMGAC
jgi:alpha/beta superfamily hydrolase